MIPIGDLRNLRAIFNYVIRKGVIAERFFPFKRFVFQPNVKSKSVLYPAQLKALPDYKCGNDKDRRAIDFFFMCYTCNGMNFHDAGLLKCKNIQGNFLTFIRHKTRKSGKEIKIYIHDLTKTFMKDGEIRMLLLMTIYLDWLIIKCLPLTNKRV